MRGHDNPEPDRILARLARRLGFDHNPLRRGTDRVEAVLRLVMIVMLVAGVPAAAVAAGQWADHRALHQAQVQRAALRVADAVLLQDASATGSPDPYTSVQYTWVLARWQPPGQPARTGEVLATAGANKGSTVRIWIDRSGAATGPPMDHRDIAGDVVMAVVVTCVVLGLLLLGADSLTRRALDRRRMDAWAAEWRVSGPRWSGRRG